ncbi:SCP2 sterol-binding domain-containing protein [Reinekea thalattae]|uniref:SCP2 sterol-binding domain-containing protein n=1 Tax=Reinekea thalattae TaxID=2593301 RepID=A0A5C8Z8U5_9GAMM|nr:SCP2 sterol-binding domain-containing protein [Reinekea thalattae]TXR53581.1 SCP2 sterol-binding domain-containing protein [Reinekea thalattae]
MNAIEQVFDKIESRFNPSAAIDFNHNFQFEIDDQIYHLVINNGQCKTAKGAHPDPSITLFMDLDTFNELISGELNGMQAFMSGKLRAEGDIMLASKLSKLFKR